MQQITKEQFEEKVLKSEKLVLVDFFAVWCGPCKAIAPVLEQLASTNKDIEVYKVDIEENFELTSKYKVNSVPNILFFKNGVVKDSIVGFTFLKNLQDKIDNNK